MDSSETLFSLELAVESLRIHSSTVMCRLPSVAFRLLDFPTLLLHHVDPEHAQNIKEKIILDSYGDIPTQLQELKDHRGNFCINKCKSSLLKMSPQILLAYLRNTPLYIMLIDMWPEVSKLVANCTISLQDTMEEILQDIERNGADVPSVHGGRDSYKLYNLMGSEVGWIVVRYRLLSMGASLIPHIPQTAFTKRRNESVGLDVTPRKNKDVNISDMKTANKEKDVVLEDLEVEGRSKSISVAVATMDDNTFSRKTAGSLEQKQQGTQTVKPSKRNTLHKNKFDGSIPLMKNDGLIVNNTHCPPPLFFNTANKDVPVSLRQYLGNDQRKSRNIPDVKNVEPDTKLDSSEDLDTVSSQTVSEDVIHQIETHYTFPFEEQNVSPSWSVRKTHRTLRTEKSMVEAAKKHQMSKDGRRTEPSQEVRPQGPDVCNRCQLQLDPNQRTQLPVLAALLQELSILHGNALPSEPLSSRTPIQVQKPHTATKSLSMKKEHLLAPVEKENIHVNHLKLNQAKPYRHRHRDCAKPPQGVPSSKGWLRPQQPVQVQHSKRKTKLQYGMTHSQKLRLQKNNPELLKKMEMRMQTNREERSLMVNHHLRDDGAIDAASEHNISTESSHHLDGGVKPLDSHPQLVELSSCAKLGKSGTIKTKATKNRRKDINRSDQQSSKFQTSRKPPMPVPRRLKGATFVWADAAQDQRATSGEMLENNGTGVGDYDYNKSRRGSRGSVEQKEVSSSEKSARSIDVYLPSASHHETGSGNNSDDFTDTESQFSTASSFISHPKTIQVPGLPAEGDISQKDVDRADDQSPDVQYSDDFNISDNLASTGEQELELLTSIRSNSYHSAESSLSNDSRSSSVRTTKSQSSQVTVTTPAAPVPRPNGKLYNPQIRRLSIPKPKLSTISPVPVRRTSKTSTMSTNTAVLTPDPWKDTELSTTSFPTPQPRPSLLRSASSFSETSLLQSTVPSSEFRTEDSLQVGQWTNKEDSEDSYSDDFNNSEAASA